MPVIKLIERLSRWSFSVTAFAPGAMAALITYDVVSRTLFNSPSLVTDELSGYLLVFIAFMGAAEALRTGGHIKVDILTSRLSPRAALRTRLVASIVSAAFLSVFWWHAVVMAWRSFSRGVTAPTSLLTPLWIPQVVIPLGMTLLLLQLLVKVADTLSRLRTTNPGRIDSRPGDEEHRGA